MVCLTASSEPTSDAAMAIRREAVFGSLGGTRSMLGLWTFSWLKKRPPPRTREYAGWFHMANDSLTRLRSRLETARADSEGTAAQELDLCLAELEVLWEELESQADQLARERVRQAAFFDHAPFACAVTDGSGAVREANRALCELLGAPAQSIAGKPLAVYFADADRAGFRTTLVKAAVDAHDGQRTWRGALRMPDAREIDVELTVTNLPFVKGAAINLLLFLRRTD
jgi:PAS domain S-box-containing protein